MDQLKELQAQIDQIDRQLVILFEQRMDINRREAELKYKQGIPILQSDLDKIALENAKSRLHNKEYEKALESFMTHLLSLSRIQQARIQTLEDK